jgi:hypothetical protein
MTLGSGATDGFATVPSIFPLVWAQAAIEATTHIRTSVVNNLQCCVRHIGSAPEFVNPNVNNIDLSPGDPIKVD